MSSVEMQTLALPGGIVGVDAEQRAGDRGKAEVELHLESGGGGGVDVDVIDHGGVLDVVAILGVEEVEDGREGEEGYQGTGLGPDGEFGRHRRVSVEGAELG